MAQQLDTDIKKAGGKGLFEEGVWAEKGAGYGLSTFEKTTDKGKILDYLAKELNDLGVDYDYIPIVMQEEHTLLHRLMFGEASKLAKTPGWMKTAEDVPTIKELLFKRDKNGNKVFHTDLDTLVVKMGYQRLWALGMWDVLEKVKKSPYAKAVKPGDIRKIDYGKEALYAPQYFKELTQGVSQVQEELLKALRGVGETDFTAIGLMKLRPEDWQRIILRSTQAAEKATDGLADLYRIPLGMAKSLEANFTSSRGGMMSYLYDGSNKFFKAVVLTLSPAWYVIGIFGNAILNMLGGVHPNSYVKALSKDWKKYIPEEATVSMFGEMDRMAKRVKPKLAQAGKVRSLWYRLERGVDSLASLQEKIDGFYRRAHFIDALEKRGRIKVMKETGRKLWQVDKETFAKLAQDPTLVKEAVDQTNSFLFDYFTLHPWERDALRRIYPFWTFTRNFNLLMGRIAKSGLQHPARSMAVTRMANLSLELAGDIEFPEYAGFFIPLMSGEDGTLIGMDLERWLPFWNLGTGALDISNTAPLIKMAYERVTGTNAWVKKPFTSNETAVTWGGDVVRFDTNTKRFTYARPVPPLVEHIARQFPQYNFLREMLYPYLQKDDGTLIDPSPVLGPNGRPVIEKDQLNLVARFMGLGLKDVNPQRYLAKRRKYRAIILRKLYKDIRSLYTSPDERQEALDAFRYVVEDTEGRSLKALTR